MTKYFAQDNLNSNQNPQNDSQRNRIDRSFVFAPRVNACLDTEDSANEEGMVDKHEIRYNDSASSPILIEKPQSRVDAVENVVDYVHN